MKPQYLQYSSSIFFPRKCVGCLKEGNGLNAILKVKIPYHFQCLVHNKCKNKDLYISCYCCEDCKARYRRIKSMRIFLLLCLLSAEALGILISLEYNLVNLPHYGLFGGIVGFILIDLWYFQRLCVFLRKYPNPLRFYLAGQIQLVLNQIEQDEHKRIHHEKNISKLELKFRDPRVIQFFMHLLNPYENQITIAHM